MIPKSHPRYNSLVKREKIVKALKKGILAKEGMIAHGRGECFDYLIGEETTENAKISERSAVALLILAEKPTISVNGNTSALVPKEIVRFTKELNKLRERFFEKRKDKKIGEKNVKKSSIVNENTYTPCVLEINIFYRTEKRVKAILKELRKYSDEKILYKPNAKIPNLEGKRALVCKEGIYSSDVILIPLEDGNRAIALKKMNKKIIAIDLNPISRTSLTADITIVDELTRAINNMIYFTKKFKKAEENDLRKIVGKYSNEKNLNEILKFIGKRIKELSIHTFLTGQS